MARVPSDATGFAHRDSRILANVAAIFENAEDLPEYTRWVEDLAGELKQGDEGDERIRVAYPGGGLGAFRRDQARYDPENLFRLNQNVPPAGPGADR